MYRLSLRLKCWGVGTLLVRVEVLGNEASENRNGILEFILVRDSQYHWKQWNNTKINSPLKTDVEKLMASTEVRDLTKEIGAGFGKDFDPSKIGYSKIVIATDADSDGAHIELELLTLFFTYMRPLLELGYIYRAVTPLYIIRDGKKETYCWTEEEYQAKRHALKGDVTRCKGLGELNAQDLKAVCFENQRYKRITLGDAQKATELLQILMGSSADLRKQYIYDNAERLGFNFV